ncbi:hypothetical protein ACOME3_004118 [Neoechinorhynchus agilis]
MFCSAHNMEFVQPQSLADYGSAASFYLVSAALVQPHVCSSGETQAMYLHTPQQQQQYQLPLSTTSWNSPHYHHQHQYYHVHQQNTAVPSAITSANTFFLNKAHSSNQYSPYNQFSASALGCNEVYYRNRQNMETVIRQVAKYSSQYGTRVSISLTETTMLVTPLEPVNLYNISANISIPYNVIEGIFVDHFYPEIVNVLYKSLNADTSNISKDSMSTYRTMLSYGLSKGEADRLRSLLSRMINFSGYYNGCYQTLDQQSQALFVPQPPSIEYRSSNNEPSSTLKGRNHFKNLSLAPLTIRTHRKLPAEDRVSRCIEQTTGSRRRNESTKSTSRRHKSNYNKHRRSLMITEKGERDNDSLPRNRSVSVSPRTMVARCFHEAQPSQNTLPTLHEEVANPSAPLLPMLRPPFGGIYNRYIPKPSVNGPPGPRPMLMNNFPVPNPHHNEIRFTLETISPVSAVNQRIIPQTAIGRERRSSKSSDSAFENMPIVTNWDSSHTTKEKVGRKVTKYPMSDGAAAVSQATSNDVLREILDEVKVVKKQISTLKSSKKSARRADQSNLTASSDLALVNNRRTRNKSRDERKSSKKN